MTKIYAFGPFRLDPVLGVLMRGDQPTALGPRATALLQRLVEEAGQPVGKEALIAAAWPGLVVEESNLTVQIAALRKMLDEAGGAAWIETLPRRGYRYAGPPVSLAAPDGPAGDAHAFRPPHKPSVAVLPFVSPGDDEQACFADGMVEDIVNGLARIRWLFVIARSSTLRYRQQSLTDAGQAGRELGVRYVLQAASARRRSASASHASSSRPRAACRSGASATTVR